MPSSGVADITQGWFNLYNHLYDHQLALYHRVSIPHAQLIRAQNLARIPASWPQFTDVVSVGGMRGGKTFGACFRLWSELLFNPGWAAMVVRKRHEQLRNTFIKEFEEVGRLIAGNGDPKNPVYGDIDWLVERASKEDGAIEWIVLSTDPQRPSKVIFRIEPDGTEEEVEDSFKGYKLNSFYLEEASQLDAHPTIPGMGVALQTLRTRLTTTGDGVPLAVVLSNPTYEGHYLSDFRKNVEKEYDEWAAWPEDRRNEPGAPALPRAIPIASRTEDNKALPEKAIAAIKDQFKNDPIGYQMFVMGLDGVKREGEPVFLRQFDRSLHVSTQAVYNPHRQLYLGWDFGFRTPACIMAQLDHEERLLIIGEVIGKDQYIESFCDDVTAYITRHFPNAKPFQALSFGDIAGDATKDTGNTIIRAQAKGYKITTTYLGEVMDGCERIRELLSEMRGLNPKLPRILINPTCKALAMALSLGYHFKNFKGRLADKPHKDGVHDHPVDAFRYLICNLLGLSSSMQGQRSQSRGARKAKMNFKLGS